jgi:cell pole-organizing protein PopZ
VAELLRPMLRQWIDENMPRLVSAALKAEAEAQSRRDPRKP